MKIAYCFMTRDNLTQPKIWEEFFRTSSHQAIILSHAKNPDKVTDKIIKDNLIPQYIKTEWGHVTLSMVMIYLAHNALKQNADWIIFLSETCVPLQPSQHINKFLEKSRYSWFYTPEHNKKDMQRRYNSLTNPKYIKPYQLKKTSQWCILNKQDAKIVVRRAPKDLRNYRRFIVPDEHFIITTLYLHYRNRYRYNEGMTTLVDWKRKSDNYKHPYTFKDNLTDEDVSVLMSTNCLFGRRFDKSSNIIQLIPELWKREVTKGNITKSL